MADLAAGDVAYTLQSQRKSDSGDKSLVMKLVFGDGALTYPSGGIPLTKANLGVPNVIKSLSIFDQGAGAGLVYKYDFVNEKIRIYRSAGLTPAGTVAAPTFTGAALAAHGHVLHLNQADVVDGAGTRINAATNLLGANSGSDIEIASVADASGAGGIIRITAGTPAGTNSAPAFTGTAVAAGNLIELVAATTAVASASTLYVEVLGW